MASQETKPDDDVQMGDQDEQWKGIEEQIEDPEEVKVIFNALDSFQQYAKVAHFTSTHMRRQAFYAMPQAHWKMLAEPPFNYLEMLDKVDQAIESNAELARIIVKTGLSSFHVGEAGHDGELVMPRQWVGSAKPNDIDKARSTLKQFYRDWTAEGASEREACYGPVMRALEAEKTEKGINDRPLKVLVPGAGLGRLVFEMTLKGYEAEGNEISYHQLLASSYILNLCEKAEQHTIYPWAHSFSNHRTRENHLRAYKVPDIHCATELGKSETGGSMSMCAADFLCLYSDDDHAGIYDAVASVFFLDTAPNPIRYLQTILHCLKPGGILVNFGPLLWHFENDAPGIHQHDDEGDGETTGIADPGSFELSDDEVMALVAKLGFEVVSRETGIDAPYINDSKSMLQMTYKASFWVARKPMDG